MASNHRLTQRSLPRPNAFVFLCGAVVYGIVTLCSLVGVLIGSANQFFGAAFEYQGHHLLFEATIFIARYGSFVMLPIMFVFSIYVPVRASKSWASLVEAWG